MIEVQHLTKRYGRVTAVDDLNFRVERGEILGFLGPNGAGKTTTMRILTGYMPATDGKAFVAGYDVAQQPLEAKRRTGYLPETPPLYPDMTVSDYLMFCARIKGVAKADRKTRVAATMERTLRVVHGTATALVVGVGAVMALRGYLTLGALIVLSSYLTQLLRPIERLNDLAETASKGLVGGERLLWLLDQQPAVKDAPDAVTLDRARGVIELSDVWFAYASSGRRRGTILRGVSLRLRPGELAVLVGASGAGKSTLLSLLVRLFDPTAGTVRLDGIPLTRITIESLRRQIATMAQDTRLFAGSIRQAVRPADESVDDQRIWEALALVAMDDFVRSLPDGLDTALGEDGVNLSGGQRQRLSLARAFLLDRPILLLDEPLSNVDAESEAVIAAALGRWRRDRTCLAITHRLSLFEHADVVYRLQDGRIVEQSRAPRLVALSREQRA